MVELLPKMCEVLGSNSSGSTKNKEKEEKEEEKEEEEEKEVMLLLCSSISLTLLIPTLHSTPCILILLSYPLLVHGP